MKLQEPFGNDEIYKNSFLGESCMVVHHGYLHTSPRDQSSLANPHHGAENEKKNYHLMEL